jgi:hypothetical protein
MVTVMKGKAVTAAYKAVTADYTIDHRTAREISAMQAHSASGGAVGDLVRDGVVPTGYADVLHLHADLFLYENHNAVYQALARYLRERHARRQTGPGCTWDTLIDPPATLASAA